MYYYTISIDQEGIDEEVEALIGRVNAPFKKRKPFSIVTTEEQMCETMAAKVARFHLVVTPDFVVKSERQAWAFCQNMRAAAEEVQAMNDANYVITPPPSKRMGGR